MIVPIDFNVEDRAESIVAFLRKMQPASSRRIGEARIEIDLSKSEYIGPYAAAILLADVREAQRQGVTTKVVLPVGPNKLRAYCQFSGLSAIFEGGLPPDESDPRCETVPLSETTSAGFSAANRLVALVKRHVEIDAEAEDWLGVCLNEATQNVRDHAKSEIGCVTTARFIRTRREVRVALVDRGRGIGESLRGRFPDLSDRQALEAVHRGNMTSGSRRGNRGLGISSIASIIRANGGHLLIASGDAILHQRPEGVSVESIGPGGSFSGTAILFSMQVAAR